MPFNLSLSGRILSDRTKLFIIHLICHIQDVLVISLWCNDVLYRVKMKKLTIVKFCYCFSLVLLLCNAVVRAEEDTSGNFDFMTNLNDPDTDAFVADANFEGMKRTFDPTNIAVLLVQTFNAPCLLSDNLYKYTYPLNHKSIIDVPAFFPARDSKRRSNFGMSLFFDQTWRMYFTQHCDAIQSYIALCSPQLLDRLSQCAECVQDFNMDPADFLPLLRNIAVQDRQTGMMLHGDKQFGTLRLHVHVPVFYQERNYYMTEDERNCLINFFAADSGSEKPCAQSCTTDQHYVGAHANKDNPVDMALVQNFLVGDRFGVGDMRIHLDWELIRRYYYKLSLGFVATIPTAFAFKKGLLGSSFEDACTPKDFSIAALIDAGQNQNAEKATALGLAFATGAFRALSHNLLDSGLGYGNHVGLGVSYATKGRLSFIIQRPWAHHVKMCSRMILQYYTPGMETRSFVENKNPADYAAENFNIDRLENDSVYAQERLDFINEKFIQELYPFQLRTMVCPGFILQSTSGYYFEYRGWKAQLGGDFWAKSGESFGKICTPPGTPPLIISCAKRPAAIQSRIHGLLAYSIPGVLSSWTISLYGDKTYWSKGIGKDFNVVFNVECNF